MVNYFEQITNELSDYEKETIVPLIIRGLQKKIGKTNVITNAEMRTAIEHKYNIKITGARLRKVIQYIRLSGQIERLIATSKGYYISNDEEELENYVESLMQRAASISALAKQMNFQLNKFKKNESKRSK